MVVSKEQQQEDRSHFGGPTFNEDPATPLGKMPMVCPFACVWVKIGHIGSPGASLGPPVVPFDQLFWGRVPLLKWTTEKRWGTLILPSLLEDLEGVEGTLGTRPTVKTKNMDMGNVSMPEAN